MSICLALVIAVAAFLIGKFGTMPYWPDKIAYACLMGALWGFVTGIDQLRNPGKGVRAQYRRGRGEGLVFGSIVAAAAGVLLLGAS